MQFNGVNKIGNEESEARKWKLNERIKLCGTWNFKVDNNENFFIIAIKYIICEWNWSILRIQPFVECI